MAILESIFGNPNTDGPNALMRLGMSLQSPQSQAIALEKQKQAQLMDLISKAGAVPMDGSMGPQQPLDSKTFLMKLAGITGDAGPLASYINSQQPDAMTEYQRATLGLEKQKMDAEQERLRRISEILGGGSPTPLQNMATGGASSGPNPLSVRNNNPGNMRPVGGSEGFQSFASPEDGLQAMTADLTAKISGQSPAMESRFGQGYAPTLENIIATWAPPEENDTESYIQTVSQKTGIPRDQVLTADDIQKIQPAMIEQEGGQAAGQYFNNKPARPEALSQLEQLAQIDPARYGGDYLTAKAAYEKEVRKEADSIITPDNENLTGEEFKATIRSKDVLNKANALLRGDMPPPTINSRTPTVMKQALEAAQQIDPSYSAATYPVRKAVKTAFSSGPEARNVNAINTVISHLGEWNKSVEALDNWGVPVANMALNKGQSIYNDKVNAKLKAAKVAAQAVGSEAAKAYQGVGAVGQEQQQEWQKSLTSDLGPEARKEVARQIGTLLVGKIEALNNQWASAFPNEPKNFLSPKAAKALKDMGIEVDGVDEAPVDGAPEGVDPKVWEFMTPEEKALFQ